MKVANTCAVCGGNEGNPRAHENGYTLLQCPCGAMFLDRPPPPGSVDPTYDPHPLAFYSTGAEIRMRWIARRVPERGIFVEIGCGEGALLAAATDLQFRGEGIEPDRRRAALATGRGFNVENALVENTTRETASCDVVYHCDLLSHFPDPVDALRQMRRILRPGGVMAFEVGLVGNLSARWYGIGSLQLPYHRWFFTEAALMALLEKSGFEMLECRRFGMGLNFRLSQIAKTLRIGGGSSRSVAEHEKLAARKPRAGPANSTLMRWLRQQSYTFVRYRLGALFPDYGPGTAFVLARPI